MKRILTLAGAALIVASCSKETNQALPSDRMVSYSQSELTGQLSQENRPLDFTTNSGKTNGLSYTLRAVAEPPIINGVATKATSVTKVGNLVYVTWHTVNASHGGAISVYDVSTPGAISYQGRVDFVDTDFHQGAVVANSNMYLVGQRNTNSGAYDNKLVTGSPSLSYWKGAIFGRLSLTAGGLLTTTYSEIPLGGFAANGLANNSGVWDVITGDEASKIYRINGTSMTITDSTTTAFEDGEFIVSNGFNMYALDGNDQVNNSNIYTYPLGTALNSLNLATVATNVLHSTKDLDRSAITATTGGDVYMATGARGVIKVPAGGGTQKQNFTTALTGGSSQGVSLDNTNNRLYIAQGEQGLFVADLTADFATTAAILGYGAKAYPTSNYKDVTYSAAPVGPGGAENWLFIADGEKGLLLIEEINTP